MRVLAARFGDRHSALEARDALRAKLGLDPGDLDIAPLGVPGEAATSDTLLAGRFADEVAELATVIIRDSGGEVVADVDEAWTRPRLAAQDGGWQPAFKRA